MSHIKTDSALFTTDQLDLFNKRLLELFVEADEDEKNTVDKKQWLKLMKKILPNPNETEINTLFDTISVEKKYEINYKTLLKDSNFTSFLLNHIMIQESLENNDEDNNNDNIIKKTRSISYSNTAIEHTVFDDDDYKLHVPNNNTYFTLNSTGALTPLTAINEYKSALNETEEELNELKIKYENIAIEFNENKDKLNELISYQTKYNEVHAELIKLDEINKSYAMQINEYINEKDTYENEIITLKEQLKESTDKVKELQENNKMFEDTYQKINENESKLNDENIVLKKQLTYVQNSSNTTIKTSKDLKDRNKKLVERIDHFIESDFKLNIDINKLKNDNEQLKETLKDKQDNLIKQINNFEDLYQKYNSVMEEFNNYKQINAASKGGSANADGLVLDKPKMGTFNKTMKLRASQVNLVLNNSPTQRNTILGVNNMNNMRTMRASNLTVRNENLGGLGDTQVYSNSYNNSDEYDFINNDVHEHDTQDSYNSQDYWGGNKTMNVDTDEKTSLLDASKKSPKLSKAKNANYALINIDDKKSTINDGKIDELIKEINRLKNDKRFWKNKAEIKQKTIDNMIKDKSSAPGCVFFNFKVY